jgi:Na+/H+ antiporter NhaD/arsenite permease-like protein
MIPFDSLSPLMLNITILIMVSLISGFVANTPTALIFIPLITLIINDYSFAPIPVLFSFIMGLKLGANLTPQGSPSDLITLKIAKQNMVPNLNFKRLIKTEATFMLIYTVISLSYVLVLTFF